MITLLLGIILKTTRVMLIGHMIHLMVHPHRLVIRTVTPESPTFILVHLVQSKFVEQ